MADLTGQTKGVQGSTITLNIFFQSPITNSLIDPDALPTVQIKDPVPAVVDSGTAIEISTGEYEYTYTIPSGATISNLWSIEWSYTINGVAGLSTENFEVISPVSVSFERDVLITDVVIDTSWLNQIKKVLAYPDTSQILLTDDQIKDLCVRPALHKYFRKFPIKQIEQFQIFENLSVDFPDLSTDNRYVYGVLDARIVNKLNNNANSSSFWELVRYNQMNTGLSKSIYSGAYGTQFDFGGIQYSRLTERQLVDSYANQTTTTYRVDHLNRAVILYSSVNAQANITWAISSNDFADVKYNYQFDVLKLAQAEFLWHFADTSGILTDSGEDISINYDEIRERGNTLSESVLEKWDEIPDVILIRGG